jgi:uncharacterized protein YciI
MVYVIIGEDVPDGVAKRNAARAAHLAHVQELIDAGRLMVAGPMLGADAPDPGPAGSVGSVIIAEFESQAAAKAWIDADAYVTQGVFAKVLVKPFKFVHPPQK